MSFIRNNVFSIIITALLSILTVIAGYFMSKVEAQETRLRAIEIQCPQNTEDVEQLEKNIKTCIERINKMQETQIQADKLIIERLNNQLFILQRLERSNGG